jgi:hypothetical protein
LAEIDYLSQKDMGVDVVIQEDLRNAHRGPGGSRNAHRGPRGSIKAQNLTISKFCENDIIV